MPPVFFRLPCVKGAGFLRNKKTEGLSIYSSVTALLWNTIFIFSKICYNFCNVFDFFLSNG